MNECRSSLPGIKIITFSDDTVILSLLKAGDYPPKYSEEVKAFRSWCEDHHLSLNVAKTKEIVFDPKCLENHNLVNINVREIE